MEMGKEEMVVVEVVMKGEKQVEVEAERVWWIR